MTMTVVHACSLNVRMLEPCRVGPGRTESTLVVLVCAALADLKLLFIRVRCNMRP